MMPLTNERSEVDCVQNSKPLTMSKENIVQFVSDLYGTRRIVLPPKKDNTSLTCAVEVFCSKPKDLSDFKAFHIKDYQDPLYVRVSTLFNSAGFTEKKIEALKGSRSIDELAEKLFQELDTSSLDDKCVTEDMAKTMKSLFALSNKQGSRRYFNVLVSFHALKVMSSNRIIEILQDRDFDDQLMLNTIIHIGTEFKINKQQQNQYVKSEKVKGVKTRYTYLFDEGEISIYAKPIGKGSFAKAKLRHMLFSGEIDAGLIFKGPNVEGIVAKNLQNHEKVKGVRNILSDYKCKYKVCTKDGQVKYFLGQELYGLASVLFGRGVHHSLVVMKDVAQALEDLHKRGLIHSDVKLANIYFKGDISVNQCAVKGVLGDLGFLTKTGTYIGCTEAFASPEALKAYWAKTKFPGRDTRIRLSNCVNAKFDSFSLGIALFALVTDKDRMYNGKDFSKAVDDKPIELTIKLAVTNLKDSLSSLSHM